MEGLQEKQLVTTRGMTYNYYLTPSINITKPTLLLLHGFPDSAHLWQYVTPLLSDKYNLIVPDLLGYGGTSKPTDTASYSYRLITTDLMEILDAEKIDTFIPVGHDWGAYLCSRIALLEPKRCLAAVIVCIAYVPPMLEHVDVDTFNAMAEQQVGFPRFAYWELFTAPDAVEVLSGREESTWYVNHGEGAEWNKEMYCVRGAMRDFVSKERTDIPLRPYAQDKKLMSEWAARLAASGWQGPLNWYRCVIDDVQMHEDRKLSNGGKIEMPVLFVGCREDGVNPPELIEHPKSLGLLPNLTVKELQAGHWCPYEKPDELAESIVAFVKAKVPVA